MSPLYVGSIVLPTASKLPVTSPNVADFLNKPLLDAIKSVPLVGNGKSVASGAVSVGL